jgi:hypothetical protein
MHANQLFSFECFGPTSYAHNLSGFGGNFAGVYVVP